MKSDDLAKDSAARITARGGRVTRTRTAVLDILSRSDRPLSQDEVAQALDDLELAYDRVTLYRTFDWLVTHQIAHRVTGLDSIRRYNATENEALSHAHFHCSRCAKVFCLESMQPTIAAILPQGFRFENAELTFYGTCPQCA